MTRRTFNFGDRLMARVIGVSERGAGSTEPWMVVLEAASVGHVLVGITHKIVPKEGMQVVMEFTAGGQHGGYWKIVQEGEQMNAVTKP